MEFSTILMSSYKIESRVVVNCKKIERKLFCNGGAVATMVERKKTSLYGGFGCILGEREGKKDERGVVCLFLKKKIKQ